MTIAIFFIFQLAAFNLGFTGGTSGIELPFAPFSVANYNQPFYYVGAMILVGTVVMSWAVRRSRFGLQLLAIRDDEDRALGLGVKTRRVKLIAFVLSAIPVGMVGGLYFYFLGQIFPQFAFDPLFDVSIALMAFLGGIGTLVGPVLGAMVLEALQQYLTQSVSGNGTYLIVYGVLFLVVILLLPRGVIPSVTEFVRNRRARSVGSEEERDNAGSRRGRGRAMTNLLDVTGVSKSFGGVHALTDCHLAVEEGRIHGLIGPNGSGKTTLFNVITGYERIQQGEVRFKGTEITNAPPDRVFGLGIGRTFQLTRIFARLSVLENMLVATQRKEGWLRSLIRRASSSAEERRAMELLEFVGIARLAHEPAGNLSYGQRKLLELASLLVADPAVLLLDEPAGGVNPTLLTHLADRISELNQAGKTFLVVEHNMEFVMNLCHQRHRAQPGHAAGLRARRTRSAPTRPCSTPTWAARTIRRPRSRSVDRLAGGHAGAPARPRTRSRDRAARPGSGDPSPCSASRRGRRLRRRGHPQAGLDRRARGRHHLHRRTQRRRQVDAAGHDQRPAAPPPGRDPLRRRGDLRAVARGRSSARGIAHVPQAHSLFPEMTVRENVEMGAFTVRDSALVGQRLAAVEELYPIVRERAHEKAGSLSGGQQRLVEFARSLMLDPAMIVLDEPSMGLDPQTRQIVFDMVELMNRRGKTILLVEQNARAGLKLSTRGVVLENGMVRLAGSGREVLEHPEIGALYLGGAVAGGAPGVTVAGAMSAGAPGVRASRRRTAADNALDANVGHDPRRGPGGDRSIRGRCRARSTRRRGRWSTRRPPNACCARPSSSAIGPTGSRAG